MKFKTDIKRFGKDGTYFINIPKVLIDTEKIEKGQKVQVGIITYNNTKTYRCKQCNHEFPSDDDIPYCPIDECEDLEVVEE